MSRRGNLLARLLKAFVAAGGNPAPSAARELSARTDDHEPYRAAAWEAATAAGQRMTVDAPGNFNRGVVGEQYYQQALEAVAGGYRREEDSILKPAVLVCEDDNPHDANAVRVEIDDRLVGYLAAKDAARLRKALAARGLAGERLGVAAKIRGGIRSSATAPVSEGFRVRLDLTWPLTFG